MLEIKAEELTSSIHHFLGKVLELVNEKPIKIDLDLFPPDTIHY